MARKKGIKKRPRVMGEFAAQTTALLDGLWAELAEAEEEHELWAGGNGQSGRPRRNTRRYGSIWRNSGRPAAQHQRDGAGCA